MQAGRSNQGEHRRQPELNRADLRSVAGHVGVLYQRRRSAWPWRIAVFGAALGLTAVTALVIPLSDLLTKAPGKIIEYRTVELSEWRPPPPPSPPPKPKPEPPRKEPPPEVKRETPRLEQPKAQPKPKLKLPVRLDFALSDFRTDLALDFEVDPDVEALPETVEPAAPAPPTPPPPPEPPPTVLDRQPAILRQVKPLYPYRARTRRIEGFVDLQFMVTASGAVEDVTTVAAQPSGVFERAAADAVRRWTFAPGIRGSEPVPARMQIRIRFTLDD